jgi:fumarylacetoacetate (FAA) hydrolase
MKLATYSDGSRDGQLVVVSRDLTQAHYASGIAGRLQTVLDDWNFYAPQLQDLAQQLNAGKAAHPFPFEPLRCQAPLPRSYQRLDTLWHQDDAQTLQCASDVLFGARDPLRISVEQMAGFGLDFGAALVVITSDVPAAATSAQADDSIALIALTNTFYKRKPTGSLGEGSGSVSLCTSIGPVAITPDELGAAWQNTRVHLTLAATINIRKIGLIDMGKMPKSFGQLIALAARDRPLVAGSIIGSGIISNYGEPVRGFACLADKRAAELAQEGQAYTQWLSTGDIVRIDIKDTEGSYTLGILEQLIELI